MQQYYNAINGQSLYDVCLMTYGSLDLITKLMLDNNWGSINDYPDSSDVFVWDDSLIVDTLKYNQTVSSGETFATAELYATNSTGIGYCLSGGNGFFVYAPSNKYIKTQK